MKSQAEGLGEEIHGGGGPKDREEINLLKSPKEYQSKLYQSL